MSHIRHRLSVVVGAIGIVVGVSLVSGATTALASTNGSLVSDDRSLHTGVGSYTDCSGHAPLQSNEAAIATCISGRTYFVGHNAGVFTPLLHMRPGDHITWTQPSGYQHRLRIVAVRDWPGANGTPPVTQRDVVAQFQTCIKPDGSLDRILDAVEDGAVR